jgi:GNAT superfamily N-acetyltransferase
MTLEKAVHVFVHGFAFTRSFTHPYLISKRAGLTVMHDEPRERERNPEYVVVGMSLDKGWQALQKAGFSRGGVCIMCGVDEDLGRVRDAYKSFGLRFARSEPMFIADPADAPIYKAPLPVVRVDSSELAERVKRAARTRQILPEHMGREDTLRLYAAINGRSAVGWVKSIPVDDCAWVSNLYVDKAMRGKGIGRALMSTMLQDDAAHGVRHSVLLASGAGSRLYPHVGYERIGTLMMFIPAKR